MSAGEHADEVSPDGMQRLLRRAGWEVDGVRDDVRAYVVDHLAIRTGVLLAYASRYGHALIDRELYLPRSWTEDPERCHAAGVLEDVGFVTKPGPGGKGGTGTSDPGMIGYTLAELRRLLNSLVQAAHPTPTASGPGPAGAGDASTRPGSAITGDAATC